MPKRRSNSPKKKQQPKDRSRSRSRDEENNGTSKNSNNRLLFAAVLGAVAAVTAYYWRNDVEETPWQPRPSDAYAPLKKIGGVLIEDFVPQRIIDELRYQLMDAVNGTCAAPVATSTRAGSKQTMVGAAHVPLTASMSWYRSSSIIRCGTKSSINTPPIFLSGAPTICLLYTSPSPRDRQKSRMPSSA